MQMTSLHNESQKFSSGIGGIAFWGQVSSSGKRKKEQRIDINSFVVVVVVVCRVLSSTGKTKDCREKGAQITRFIRTEVKTVEEMKENGVDDGDGMAERSTTDKNDQTCSCFFIHLFLTVSV